MVDTGVIGSEIAMAEESGIWSKPNNDNFTQCIELPRNHKRLDAKTNGYILINANGDLNQMRFGIYGEDEWSFGFWEQGTGVFSCPSRKNMIRKKLRPVKTMSFKANGSRSSSHINFLLIIVLLYITFWFSILHIFGSIIVLI
ncbi:hypothetical protein Ahy_B02g061615 isoform A [Arachis hypogaea]|uniref:Uncharacterized protein n=1 Tax=Arachis hypogaea TaxID=3818 RepID=A0A445ALI8_ARAHY|nr:hypothetical protein Ahy_B02g061615 isoform A [Arachis hypogaea]